jgi:hypothetical protein
LEHSNVSGDAIPNQLMWTKFIGRGRIELFVRKEALASVDLLEEGRQQISAKTRRNKLLKRKEFVMLLKENLVKQKEDLASIE